MQFCTIDEAWGKRKLKQEDKTVTEQDTIANQTENNLTENSIGSLINNNKTLKSLNPNNYKNKIYFNNTEDSYAYTDTINDKSERNALINKVLNSKRCRETLRKKLTPNLVNKLNIILENYKDVIIIVLIGFCILIFLNMLYNISKK